MAPECRPAVCLLSAGSAAHSGDCGHPFRLIPDIRSGRNRTGWVDAVAHSATSKNLRGRSGVGAGRRGVREPLRRVGPGFCSSGSWADGSVVGGWDTGPFGLASPSGDVVSDDGGPRLRALGAGLGCAVPWTPVCALTRASCMADATKMTSTRIARSVTRRRRSCRGHAGGATGLSRRCDARTGGFCPGSPRPGWDPPWLGASHRPGAG